MAENGSRQASVADAPDAHLLSEDEVKKIHEDIVHGNDDVEDEFQDADGGETGPDSSGNWAVSEEEMSIIRAELACEFPDDYKYLSDAYVKSVASKPYSKDPTQRRPLEYTMEKLSHVMEWRQQAGAPEMEDLLKLANGPATATEAVENPEKFAKAKALTTALNYGSTYWHGMTKEGKPILWIRCDRKPWYPDVDAEVNALILIADAGIRNMPKNCTDFVCLSDSNYPPPPNATFMINMLKALVRGYPDRLAQLVSAPVGSIIQFVMKLLTPLMPGRLASKVVLLGQDEMIGRLEDILLNGNDDIPTFFGGPCNHDEFYPIESACPNRGEGSLKFDYFGMVERLEKTVKDYEAAQG
uniref:CRAL-TRIO domain-containing protein n=1 Tax=Trieres chinensis TaxID=1514140 RepID=A0A7S1ZVJ2_TRICV|mmetsp:Transcript_34223/g.69885  ORF Transcript_34223/g.69885 Transcript_34223/m.69885 type:complete len:356 (+) Transcript_34223:150-1217(+)|eukprot:CAMPEP_0183307372 /NCGR_PEP_ID=MMETSP0160_2-20130417/17294_1 /TAXON_ID=2839 ORGANISM="Odontella Sinensis, Strain Grunow 1884" /NCGR_SAMPLE_ID=MMETSP0160_2 /ASSEMBLY_ACC=CAM_ASM_000250 /LENGTH=355 /DNA_ID=CAMNT_0025470947 /DNA_START=145 /DNA_END=1212 /DNA_ORIENTATION=-